MAAPVDLNRLLPDARQFLAELAQNNDRAWFQAHKTRYDGQLKRPSEKLLARIAQWLRDSRAMSVRVKLFRPHRDARFTEDKTPYHTHLHMMWSLPDGRAWVLGISPEYATAGAGLMRFDPAQQTRWRAALDTDRGPALTALLGRQTWRLDPPELPQVPSPWPPDHPHAALLRRQGLVAWRDDLEEALSEDPETALKTAFAESTPLMDWLAGIA